ncbi:MAG: serine/threonine protein kinase [Acidimicrobiia bacterium]|nr:serine/threonine protein kinase [Acidimicrobiia bacterium]
MRDNLAGYRLERLIGRGGTGEVWLAWDQGPVTRAVAVKRVGASAGPTEVASLRAEAELLATLDHPHLLRALDVIDDPPGVALVLPYLGGGSLRSLLDDRGVLAPGEVVAVLAPVADAAGSLHRRGVIHGDLKPDNVLITSDGDPVCADVGVARIIGRPAAGLTVAGTPAYLDPAVAEGSPATPRSDVYALGVMAYEALTGRLPHVGEPAEVVALAASRVHRPLGSWPALPEAVAQEVERALDPDPAARHGCPVDFIDALRTVVPTSEVRLPGVSRRSDPAEGWSGSHTVPIGLVPSPEDQAPPVGRGVGLVRTLGAIGVVAIGVAGAAGLTAGGSRAGTAGGSPPRSAVPGGPAAPSPASSPSAHREVVHPAGDGPGYRGATECVEVSAPAGAGTILRADVDADGCAEMLRWDGRVLRVVSATGTRTYRIGTPADQLLLGDWDGDGAASPALYRASSGEVFYADRFPDQVGNRVEAARVERVARHGTADVSHPTGGRDVVKVEGGT